MTEKVNQYQPPPAKFDWERLILYLAVSLWIILVILMKHV